MESDIPRYDLTVDYIVGEGFGINLLNGYKNFHCKIEAGFFILCVKGTIQATINGERYNMVENDLIMSFHLIFIFIMQAFHLSS